MALGDDLKYPRPGQPVYTAPRAFYHRVIDLSRAERDGRYNGGGVGPLGGYGVMTALVKNATAAAVPVFGVLELSGLVSPPAVGDPSPPIPPEAFTGAAPSGTAGKAFCITLDALAADEACLAAVAGIVPAFITGTGAYAAPQAGNTGTLLAGSAGAPILWSEAGTADRWSYLLLPPAYAATAATFTARTTSTAYDSLGNGIGTGSSTTAPCYYSYEEIDRNPTTYDWQVKAGGRKGNATGTTVSGVPPRSGAMEIYGKTNMVVGSVFEAEVMAHTVGTARFAAPLEGIHVGEGTAMINGICSQVGSYITFTPNAFHPTRIDIKVAGGFTGSRTVSGVTFTFDRGICTSVSP